MRDLFGVPVTTLAVVLAVLVVVTLALVGVLALRHRVFVRLGARNIGRRRGRSAIIVGGLMLGTMIIGSALGFGDIMAHTVRTSVISAWGQTDEVVSSTSTEGQSVVSLGQAARARYLTAAEAARVMAAAERSPAVDGVAPAISENVAVQDPASRQNEPRVTLFATDPARSAGFGTIRTTSGDTVSLADLAPGQAFLNAKAADDLSAHVGDRITVLTQAGPQPLTVRQIVEYDGTGTDGAALLLPLGAAQKLLAAGNTVQFVMVSNNGDTVSGADRTSAVSSALEPVTRQLGLQIDPVKRDGLDTADEQGATFLQMFTTFGTFTISAGILLIFLVFALLAAERRGEMGTARAIGTQRRHLVEIFVFEGVMYALLAAAVGAVLGLLVAVGMVWAIAGALADTGIVAVRYDLRWTSLMLAFSLGFLMTVLVVVVAAWRVSRLNIVTAVRNLPQPPRTHRRRAWWALVLAALAGGGLLILLASTSKDASTFLLGGALVLAALVPLVRGLGGSPRLAFSISGVCIVVWGLLPFGAYGALMPGLEMGFSMWVVGGLLLVTGGTWVVVYNIRPVLAAAMWAFGRSRSAAPVMKTAIAQSGYNRFRTGATIGLFTLVIFTLVTGATISNSFLSATNDLKTFGGGYDITAQTSPLTPIPDMGRALARAHGINRADITAYAAQSYLPVTARQVGQPRYADYLARGLDPSFLRTTTYGFAARATGYSSDRAVWQALATHPNLAVVDSYSVPRRSQWGFGSVSDFRLSGFFLEDGTFNPVPVQVRDPQSHQTLRLKVIGVFSDKVPLGMVGISTSQRTLAPLGAAAVPTVWYFKVAPGVDPTEEAKRLEAAFLDRGMQATAQRDTLHDAVSSSLTFQYLILGFLGLGLVIGVAALGVISARAVVERRQQIGVLRAVGFQKRMVGLSMLVESLFVTLLGTLIGTLFGLVIAYNVVSDTASQPGWDNLTLTPPWPSLIVILTLVLLSSILTTWLPSRRAARTYPAEALRYQ